jgi:hypothetical protein
MGAAAAILIAATVFGYLTLRDPSYDRSFDTRIVSPAYPSGGPVVLYDEGHLNTHTSSSGYRPLAELMRSDGYTLHVTSEPLTAERLGGVAVLALVLARGSNDANDGPAYSDAEIAAIEQWVRAGGSLLLVTDHWPYGPAVSGLAARFGVSMGGGMAEDPIHHDSARGDSHLIYSAENGLLHDHPIVRGRNASERVQRVLTFTGQSLQGPAEAVAFLALSDSATERPPGPATVDRTSGDVRISMEYGAPAPARGRAQGIALEVGAGRVVVLGEAGMLRAQRDKRGLHVGMNVVGYDNRQLAINIMRWLSRVL